MHVHVFSFLSLFVIFWFEDLHFSEFVGGLDLPRGFSCVGSYLIFFFFFWACKYIYIYTRLKILALFSEKEFRLSIRPVI